MGTEGRQGNVLWGQREGRVMFCGDREGRVMFCGDRGKAR